MRNTRGIKKEKDTKKDHVAVRTCHMVLKLYTQNQYEYNTGSS